MTKDADKMISKCFENLEKAEVLGSLLYEKLMGEKETDVTLLMINSFVTEAKLTLLELQTALKEVENQ